MRRILLVLSFYARQKSVSEREDQPSGIDQHVALAAFDLFASIVATSPPFCVVFTD
jgi:hypothetical protein